MNGTVDRKLLDTVQLRGFILISWTGLERWKNLLGGSTPPLRQFQPWAS